jgi:hypothetical protein
MNFDPTTLLPGDHLLYGPGRSIFNRIVCLKTWSPVSHIEIYVGHSVSVASRNGIGVRQFPVRLTDLAFVLRPLQPVNMAPAMAWFASSAKGQAYDWKGLLCFVLAVKQGSRDKMFCSEFATRWDRHAFIHSFSPTWDADKVAPGNYLMSPAFRIVWQLNYE